MQMDQRSTCELYPASYKWGISICVLLQSFSNGRPVVPGDWVKSQKTGGSRFWLLVYIFIDDIGVYENGTRWSPDQISSTLPPDSISLP